MAIDTVAARAELRDNWNVISAGWTTWQDRFERGGAAVTRRLLKLAGVRAGHRVLDVGTGLGEPALSAARAVGPSGKVVGIDVSDEMLSRAGARADAAHLTNVEFVVSDPEIFDPGERFDVVLSRWCLMLTPDRMAALRALRRLLVPGGVFAAAVWSRADAVPMLSLAFPVLNQRLNLTPPPAGQPGPYAMADPERCRSELTMAGFDDVMVVVQAAPFWLSSPQEYANFSRDVLPARLRGLLRDRFGSVDDPDTWAAVSRQAERFRTPDGRVALTSTALCLRGRASMS